jgi:N4-(beta-N-acetylglucosaminyl)-L-asparaginase
MVVEYMRMGKSPEQACLAVCERIVDHARAHGLKSKYDKPTFNVKFYAIDKAGNFGSAGIKGPYQYSVCDKHGNRHEHGAFLFSYK